MSHAQDTEMYDKVMRVIIKMELAYNRHNLEKGLVIVLRKVIPLSLCVCVCGIYDRHSKVHVLRQDLMSCNNVGIVATPSCGVIKTRGLKKKMFLHVDVTWTILQTDWFIVNIRTCVGRDLFKWSVDRILIRTFKMRDFFVGGITRNMQITSVLLSRRYLLSYCAFREENFVESSKLKCWTISFTGSRSVTC